jgi:hypothetical protein
MLNLSCVLLLAVLPALAADVSGTWQFIVETNRGTGSPTVQLQQQGQELTGTFSSQVVGEVSLTGSVKGADIEFRFEGEVGGQAVRVTYKGKLESPTVMKGTAVYSGFDARATWTAKRK